MMSVLKLTKGPSSTRRNRIRGFRNDGNGSSLIECALLLPIFLFLLAGAADFGRTWYMNLEVSAAAEAGALYGVQNFNDITGMNAAALLDAPDIKTLQSSATYGLECSDGTSVMPLSTSSINCGANSVVYVEVVTTAVYSPILKYPGISSIFTLSAKSRLRASNE